MYYEIVATGSRDGNCVIINDVMIDCGVSFKQINAQLYNIRYLLLTHIHSDHIKESTLKAIKTMFPKITIIGNHEVHQLYGVDIIANANYPIFTDYYIFNPFECVHNVLTYGYTWQFEQSKILYATDTSSMEYAPNEKFDYIFLESNHDESKLETILQQANEYGYNAYDGAKRHLSTQQAKNFFYTHRTNPQAKFIELHQSSRFY